MKIIYQNIKINIAADNSTVTENTAVIDKKGQEVLGLAIFSKRLDQVDLRGSFRLDLGGQPIFPENTDTKMLTTNASVPVKEKFYMFPEPIAVGNSAIDWRYKCDANALVPFVAHDVTLVLMLREN
jgi:hypothetical protein